MVKKTPWAYIKCTKCDASIPVYGSEKCVSCQKCGARVTIGRPKKKH